MNTVSAVVDPPRVQAFAKLWHDSVGWLFTHSLQILVGLVIGAIIVAILAFAKWAGMRVGRADPDRNHWTWVIGKALAQTKLWYMVAVAAHVVASYGHAPADLARTTQFLFVIAVTLQLTIYARALILGLIEHRATVHGGLGSALNVIRLLVTVALFALAAILILSNLGVNVTGLIAGLGVGGIAIGLAAQGIFADLFAALAILFDRPFRQGDAIRVGELSGSVEAIGLKSTRIRALTGEQVIVANKQLLEKEIHNLARLDRRRIVVTLGLTYQTELDELEKIPETMRAVVEECELVTLVRCGVVKFADSSIDVELQYDVHSQNYDVVFSAQHQVNVAILRRFAELGLDFAYPTQTSFAADAEGRLVPLPSEALKPDVV